MNDQDHHFHETWLGMMQPVEGLVVSIPVLVDAQCMQRAPPELQGALRDACQRTADDHSALRDLPGLLSRVLGFTADAFEAVLPGSELELYVAEGRQILRPTLALRAPDDSPRPILLLWDLPEGLELDRPESLTGAWDYPPSAKFDRLLRHARVPIGLLTNRRSIRLVYAPTGEASGSLTFHVDDMLSVSGRPIFDAFVMLLSAQRFFGVAKDQSLPELLSLSRRWQATVTERLAEQVFEAVVLLLKGFQDASTRDGRELLVDALRRGDNHLYRGLLTALLRVVFLLYAEDAGLLPTDDETYANGFSVLGLFERLRRDRAMHPDSMPLRFGAWSQLVSVFRAVYLGAEHGALVLPPRRGSLFDPHRFPFLEGWGPDGSAPVTDVEARAGVDVPTVDDGTVLAMLERLVLLDGQRLSYRSLDVEQIGSVYEAMLGYTVIELPDDAVCLGPARQWVTGAELLAVPGARRGKALRDLTSVTVAAAKRDGLRTATTDRAVLDALEGQAAKGPDGRRMRARRGELVLQPSREGDVTTAHYTPRTLTSRIVRRCLEPVIAALGDAPASESLLSLKVCDPAMGSGAFLVEACRVLAEHVVGAWAREGELGAIAAEHGDPLIHARRLVAQRCLYGVDRNADAVELAKLSLWLVTLARDLPFTFVDHALRHGDSLVGLSFEQVSAFHWDGGQGIPAIADEIDGALHEAIGLRAQIAALATDRTPEGQRERERLLWDANDALARVRLVADAVVGAYFEGTGATDREKRRQAILGDVLEWLGSNEASAPLSEVQSRLRAHVPAFHWMLEFPEIFHAGRRDPLGPSGVGRARMDAFGGNMPFIGGRRIATIHGETYASWLIERYGGTGGTDYVAYFFLRADELLGDSGTMSFIATNSISQGDNRRVGLQRLLGEGLQIYEVERNLPWPGGAGVIVSILHLAKGESRRHTGIARLDGDEVATVNSYLRRFQERASPARLASNDGVAFVGCFLRGEGFILSKEDAAALLAASPAEARVVRPFLVGEDVNTDPGIEPARFVIDFGSMDLEQARTYPRALAIVEERVRPDRERLKTIGADASHRKFWWRFANPRVELRRVLAKQERCLVAARVSKHLVFAWVPTTSVFSEQVVAFDLTGASQFAVLQSRVHELWVRLVSSTMGEGLRYSATDCFETFPFPVADVRALRPDLEDVGRRAYEARAKYMVDEGVGLTTAYNRMKDATCDEPRVVRLREIHEEVDRVVLGAYGWSDVGVPPFCPVDDGERKKMERFEDQVIDRLFVLNDTRAREATEGRR